MWKHKSLFSYFLSPEVTIVNGSLETKKYFLCIYIWYSRIYTALSIHKYTYIICILNFTFFDSTAYLRRLWWYIQNSLTSFHSCIIFHWSSISQFVPMRLVPDFHCYKATQNFLKFPDLTQTSWNNHILFYMTWGLKILKMLSK